MSTTSKPQPVAFTSLQAASLNYKFVISGLFIVAFCIRLFYAAQFTFPPLDDPAYYVQTARSLFSAHPLQISIIWNFQPRFSDVLHPALDYWQPLPVFAIGLTFLLFGQNLLAAQLPSVLAGALLPVLTFVLGQSTFNHNRLMQPEQASRLSLFAAIFIAINPLMVYQSTSPDSSMLYALLVTFALIWWDKALKNGGWQALVVGLLIGLAYLTRTPAIFLVAALVLGLFVRSQKQNRYSYKTGSLLLAGIGLLLPIIIWSIRNILTFGFVTSPAGLQAAYIFDYQSLFNFQAQVDFKGFVAGGVSKIIEVRWEALTNAWFGVLDQLFFPTVLPAVIGVFLLLREKQPAIRFSALYSLFLFLGLPLIFGVTSTNGSYYHSVGSCAPVLAIGLVYAAWKLAEWVKLGGILRTSLLPALVLLIISLTLLKFVASFNAATEIQNSEGATYRQIDTWLKTHPAKAVITNEPASINYATNVPAIRLPADEDLNVLAKVTTYYHADYIIITESVGKYPTLLQNTEQNRQFKLVYRPPDASFEIYSVS